MKASAASLRRIRRSENTAIDEKGNISMHIQKQILPQKRATMRSVVT